MGEEQKRDKEEALTHRVQDLQLATADEAPNEDNSADSAAIERFLETLVRIAIDVAKRREQK